MRNDKIYAKRGEMKTIKNKKKMSKHVLMDRTLRNMRGHLTIAQILTILVSLTKSLFELEKHWRLGTPLLLSMLTIIESRFLTNIAFFLNNSYLIYTSLHCFFNSFYFLLFSFRLFLHSAFHFYPSKAVDRQPKAYFSF